MRKAAQGQAVIEYAGALVIAATLVSLVLVIFPTPFTDYFFEIIDVAATFMLDTLNSAIGA